MSKTSFIRGNLTFWKCVICRGWHEGEIHKCPTKEVFNDIDKLASGQDKFKCGLIEGLCDRVPVEDLLELKKKHLNTSNTEKVVKDGR